MRIMRIFFFDVRYQFKYGFYFLYAIISAVYVSILFLLPESILRPVTALIILSDPAALGFFFVGGMVLLERGEGLHSYYAILPASIKEYILAKVVSLGMISTLVGVIIVAVVLTNQVNYVLLVAGLFIGACIFTMFGLIVGTMARSINHYFVLGIPVGAVLMSPAFLIYFNIDHILIEILPATLLLRMLHGALGLMTPHHPLWSLLGLIVWCLPAFLLANGFFARYIRRVGG